MEGSEWSFFFFMFRPPLYEYHWRSPSNAGRLSVVCQGQLPRIVGESQEPAMLFYGVVAVGTGLTAFDQRPERPRITGAQLQHHEVWGARVAVPPVVTSALREIRLVAGN
ncbi:hypothetical protein TcCL_NonESM05555 [Trypanosoma cruzi]|nr:hypothetical protein TcCL_NonESM05555 [Trypanosoma cruzi]